MRAFDAAAFAEIATLSLQLKLDVGILFKEIHWALGEERINRCTPTLDQFRSWRREQDGLCKFWDHATVTLGIQLEQDDIHDIWTCIALTVESHVRRPLSFQDYLLIAVRSDQKCEVCGRRPPEVELEIDHILPASKGGTESPYNLRFLCEFHNRSRGNRFHWADLWRSSR